MNSDKFKQAFQKAHELTCDSVRFDEPTYDMLIVTEQNYLQSLKMQSASIAYYGTLAKQSERDLEQAERKYRFRYNEMYSDCSDTLSRLGKSSTVKNIQSFVQTKYEKELETLNQNLLELRKQKDMVETFYEAIKAKGFVLNSMTALVTSNLLSPKTSITEEQVEESERRRKFLERLRERE